MNINKIIFAGNLTRDPELKALPSGINVCNLTIASNETYTKDGEKKETTEYGNIVLFGKQAENTAKYLKKGDEAFVEGKLQTRSWENDGVKHYRTEIVGQSIQFGAKRNKEATSPENESVLPDYPEDNIKPEDVSF